MTDYQYVAERAFNKARWPGSKFWLENTPERRDFFAAFARAVEEEHAAPPLDTWCPECDDLKDEIRGLEDDIDGLNERIDNVLRILKNA